MLQRKTLKLLQAPPANDGPAPEPEPERHEQVQGIAPQFITYLHGKAFIQYAGLLQAARAQGLQSLDATWTFNDEGLSLAHAVATFTDGRRHSECGDSTPSSGKRVGDAWRRLALTRAKARALRDALALGICSIEEMG